MSALPPSVVIGCFRDAGGGALVAGDVIVVVDVIRATTTAVTAVAQGRRCFTAPNVAAARRRAIRLERPLLAGEFAGVVPAGFELDNSPAAIAARSDVERPLLLVSSSGTPLIHAAALSGTVYLGSLRNARYLGLWLAGRHARVAIVAAASRGEFREEDRVCCATVAGELLDAGYAPEDDATAALVKRWRGASPDAWLASKSVEFLRATGHIDDLEFILEHQDDLPDVFQMHHGEVLTVPAGIALPA
jgi:2-phosphosulfolactate phosphatase